MAYLASPILERSASPRLVELMAEPGDAKLLAPLAIDEILIRLLCLREARSLTISKMMDAGSAGQRSYRRVVAAWNRVWDRLPTQPSSNEAMLAMPSPSYAKYRDWIPSGIAIFAEYSFQTFVKSTGILPSAGPSQDERSSKSPLQ